MVSAFTYPSSYNNNALFYYLPIEYAVEILSALTYYNNAFYYLCARQEFSARWAGGDCVVW